MQDPDSTPQYKSLALTLKYNPQTLKFHHFSTHDVNDVLDLIEKWIDRLDHLLNLPFLFHKSDPEDDFELKLLEVSEILETLNTELEINQTQINILKRLNLEDEKFSIIEAAFNKISSKLIEYLNNFTKFQILEQLEHLFSCKQVTPETLEHIMSGILTLEKTECSEKFVLRLNNLKERIELSKSMMDTEKPVFRMELTSVAEEDENSAESKSLPRSTNLLDSISTSTASIIEPLQSVQEWLLVAESSLENSNLENISNFTIFQETFRHYRELHEAITQKHENLTEIFEAGADRDDTKQLTNTVLTKWYDLSQKVIETCRNLTDINEMLANQIEINETVLSSIENSCNEWRLSAASDVEKVDFIFANDSIQIQSSVKQALEIFMKHLNLCDEQCTIFLECQNSFNKKSEPQYGISPIELDEEKIVSIGSGVADSVNNALAERSEKNFIELDGLKLELEARTAGMAEVKDQLQFLETSITEINNKTSSLQEVLVKSDEPLETSKQFIELIDTVKLSLVDSVTMNEKRKNMLDREIPSLEKLFQTYRMVF